MDKRKLAYSYEEAAAALGISKSMIGLLVRNGDLAPRYIGTKPVLPATELESWLDSLPSEAK
jgi:excisionase family DNA binding protein